MIPPNISPRLSEGLSHLLEFSVVQKMRKVGPRNRPSATEHHRRAWVSRVRPGPALHTDLE